MKQNSKAWAAQLDVLVLDPDGWDRSNFDVSWGEEIDEEEFRRRLQRSTAMRVPKKTD